MTSAFMLSAASPAQATLFASTELCLGTDCSKKGFDVPVSSASDGFHRDTGEPGQTGQFDVHGSANVSPRKVGVEAGFQGTQLSLTTFNTPTAERPGGAPLIARAAGTAEDELSISAPGLSSGFVSFTIGLHGGGIDGCTAVTGCSSALPFASPDLLVQWFAQAGGQGVASDIFRNADLTKVGGVDRQYVTTPVQFSAGTPLSVRFGITADISLGSLIHDPNAPSLFTSGGTVDFANTGVIERVQVFDRNLNPVGNFSISSSTDTDWQSILTVPEAKSSTALLAGLCALAMAWFTSHKRRTTRRAIGRRYGAAAGTRYNRPVASRS